MSDSQSGVCTFEPVEGSNKSVCLISCYKESLIDLPIEMYSNMNCVEKLKLNIFSHEINFWLQSYKEFWYFVST